MGTTVSPQVIATNIEGFQAIFDPSQATASGSGLLSENAAISSTIENDRTTEPQNDRLNGRFMFGPSKNGLLDMFRFLVEGSKGATFNARINLWHKTEWAGSGIEQWTKTHLCDIAGESGDASGVDGGLFDGTVCWGGALVVSNDAGLTPNASRVVSSSADGSVWPGTLLIDRLGAHIVEVEVAVGSASRVGVVRCGLSG